MEQNISPGGMVPATGHWRSVDCLKRLHEWADGPAANREDLVNRLVLDRECPGFTERQIGLDPPGHHFIAPARDSLRATKRGNRIAAIGLAIGILVLIVATITLIKNL